MDETSLLRKCLGLLYSLVCYLFSMLVLVYFVGFIGPPQVLKDINSGPSTAWYFAVAIDVLLISLFALQHSGMARKGFKRFWLQWVPAPIERATYVLFSSLALSLMFLLWQPIPLTLWDVQAQPAQGLINGLYWLGWIIVLLATFLLSHFELFGLKQALDPFRPHRAEAFAFKTPWLYQLVRHPLYLGFVMTFWATPHMTVGHLLFATVSTLYILIGTLLEEKDLHQLFGEQYRQYQRRVGMLLPFWGRK
ncbi:MULTISPECIES: methanethiol S-methyltransferase [Pseudomonas]|uniref:methanethiol S-methyltransferase n=1 Tax=Pseudomonas fluorescens TaxID=294 RepID=A0A5E6XBA8_PSEFL|nr:MULTISPECIES: methanethiol S-methyltransferase [Pseudomonas]VVN37925.1 hypothetical protein PS652_05234 [Pseudomonas fluorescens]